MSQTRRLAAILAADVAGYSRLMGDDEEGTHERLKAHIRELVDPKIEEHHGRTVKNTGDGFLAEFPSVVDAVRCAVAIQRGMVERNADTPEDKRISFRIGVNLGDVIVEDHDVFGNGVNIAARLEALVEPGGICVSRVVRDQTRDRLPYSFEDMGEQRFKNIARPVRVYWLRDAATEITSAPAQATMPLPDKPSIAVLPFENMSGDPEQEYFADGMVEEIITALSRIRWLFVIARNSTFTYKGQPTDVKQVGRELGVRYVLEGSVRKAGGRVRITAQLIDAASGVHLWADRFDGSLEDVFELQDRVASSAAGVIEPTLRKAEFERVSRKPTESLDAYDLCLRALALRDRRSAESVYEAIRLLKQALAIDPNYTSAKAQVGWFRAHETTVRGCSPVSEADGAEAVALAKDALERGKDDPDTLSMAAFTLSFFGGEHDVAATAIERALALNPNSAQAWMMCGLVRCYRGQPDPAIEAFRQAMRLSPLDSLGRLFTAGIALAHMVAGRYEESADWAERTLRQAPGHTISLLGKAVACAHLDRIEEARNAISQLLEVQPWLTIAWFRASVMRYPSEIRARYVAGLRKAGMPEE
jgi:TolB-like protein/class 3 adenylate cyclase/Flp pilus assembly protein TadD